MSQSCPYCGQGALYRIEIRKIGIESYICDECDTVWLRYEDVRNGLGTFADNLLKWLGSETVDYLAEFEYLEVREWPVSYSRSQSD